MNCQDVRRLILADPKLHDHAVHLHLVGCAECSHFADELGSFESTLNRASKVEVPEGLASRILLRQCLTTKHNWRKRPGLATAAVFLLGFVGILSVFFTNGLDYFGSSSLEQVVLQHVNDELHHLEDHKNLSVQQLNSVLKEHGNKIRALPGRTINYAGACPIRNNQGAHVIVDSASGPMTILFMPGEFVGQRSLVKDKRFHGVIIPTEQGSMAIVGEDPLQIEQLERELRVQIINLS